ncbi:Tn3 family transposase, partial [Salmonella enterica]|nr:Tn3 family transposase [Salmonella enterica]
ARAICYGQKGETRKRYTDSQEEQLGALGLVTNAVVLWMTLDPLCISQPGSVIQGIFLEG